METARSKPPYPAQQGTAVPDNPSGCRDIDSGKTDGVAAFLDFVEAAVLERLLGDKDARWRLAEAVMQEMASAARRQIEGEAPPQPVVLPGVVPVDVPPAPKAAKAPKPRRAKEPPKVPARKAEGKGSHAYRERKAWAQRNYYRKQKGLPPLPKPKPEAPPAKQEEAPAAPPEGG